MSLRIRHIDPDATPSSQVSLEALARIIPEATVAEVLKECDATEQRTRKLSAAFVVDQKTFEPSASAAPARE